MSPLPRGCPQNNPAIVLDIPPSLVPIGNALLLLLEGGSIKVSDSAKFVLDPYGFPYTVQHSFYEPSFTPGFLSEILAFLYSAVSVSQFGT